MPDRNQQRVERTAVRPAPFSDEEQAEAMRIVDEFEKQAREREFKTFERMMRENRMQGV
jgi:hypothetical protein